VPDFRLPRTDEHVAILGRNGSGKTQFAAWMLSERAAGQVWIILNTKGDELLDSIPHAMDYAISDRIPRSPGIYVARPIIGDKKDAELLDAFYRKIWERQNTGVFVDEGYVSTGLRWFRANLTQGRSRRIPMMILAQRPVWLDRFVWSEASHYAAFDLNLEDDRDTANKMIPGYKHVKLPRFHSVWHDVKADLTIGLTPAPDAETILQRFRDLAPVRRRAI